MNMQFLELFKYQTYCLLIEFTSSVAVCFLWFEGRRTFKKKSFVPIHVSLWLEFHVTLHGIVQCLDGPAGQVQDRNRKGPPGVTAHCLGDPSGHRSWDNRPTKQTMSQSSVIDKKCGLVFMRVLSLWNEGLVQDEYNVKEWQMNGDLNDQQTVEASAMKRHDRIWGLGDGTVTWGRSLGVGERVLCLLLWDKRGGWGYHALTIWNLPSAIKLQSQKENVSRQRYLSSIIKAWRGSRHC